MTSFNSQILRDEDRCVMHFETNDVEKLKIMEQVARCLVDGASTMGEISDGYHTFNELYDHRAVLFAVICNEHPHLAWKSKLHHTGDMFDGMFIVGMNTTYGQISYHYDMRLWDLFVVPELEHAPEWDGHTPADVVKRLERVAEDVARKQVKAQTDMTKQEALNVLIAVACCSSSELYCEECPKNKYTGDEISPSLSDEICTGWNDHEVAEAVKVLREVPDA